MAAGRLLPRPRCISPRAHLSCVWSRPPHHPARRAKAPMPVMARVAQALTGRRGRAHPHLPDHEGPGRPSASVAPPLTFSKGVAQEHLHMNYSNSQAAVELWVPGPGAPGSDPWGWCPGSAMGIHPAVPCVHLSRLMSQHHTLHTAQPPLKERFSHGWRFQTMF